MSPAKRGTMTACAALLRGINLGARNKVAMPALRTLVKSLGHEDVRTYIQSGNVVFKTRSGKVSEIASTLESAITKEFGLRVAVVVRTEQELKRVAGANPFLAAGAETSALHVVFLGFGRSKLSLDYFERILGGPATVRNWNTVNKLLELMASSS